MTSLGLLWLVTAGVLSTAPPDASDLWPTEYVLRPQTIPAGWVRASITSSGYIPHRDYRRPTTGAPYPDTLRFRGGLSVGVTPRIEAWIRLPQLGCFADGTPDPCESVGLAGAGMGFGVEAIRTRPLRLSVRSSLYVVSSNTPDTLFAWSLASRLKWLAAERLAIEVELTGNRWLNPPLGYSAAGTAGAVFDFNVQATRHLLVYADAYPFAPLDHLGRVVLQLFGGAAWSFDNGVEIGLSGGVQNVLPRQPGDATVPGEFVNATIGFWL